MGSKATRGEDVGRAPLVSIAPRLAHSHPVQITAPAKENLPPIDESPDVDAARYRVIVEVALDE